MNEYSIAMDCSSRILLEFSKKYPFLLFMCRGTATFAECKSCGKNITIVLALHLMPANLQIVNVPAIVVDITFIL